MHETIYFVRQGDKAFYTFDRETIEDEKNDYTYWVINSEPIIPYIMEWPRLLNPQTIH